MSEFNSQNSQTVVYDDKIARYFLWATLIWGIIGMSAGALAALQLAWWPANTGLPWLTFGRIRPIHTNAVVFAFAGNAFFTALYYSMQRLLKTRMWSNVLSWTHFWGWQFIIVSVAVTLLLGITQSKEYAEFEWPIDVLITLIWVVMCVNVFMTIAIRKVKHLYVSIWFYLASIITIAILHIVNALAIPVSFWKSYPIYAGVQDALVQWWYGHNAVGFLLTTPFLGMMYYFLPKVCNQPVYSYRLSIIHFWSLVFIYIWAGPHHLLYTSLPEWTQSLGMVFSLMLIAPSWGGMINGFLTMRGKWDQVRTDPILKFFVLALTFYGMATLEGPLLSIKTVNLLSHYTDWTIAHVHGGALGWVGGMVFAMAYYLAPKFWNVPLYSVRLANIHFWIATIGMLLYVTSMWVAGIAQGLMWFATDEEGLLRYPQFMETVLALMPLYWIRLIGGLLYIFGAILCLYNIYKTATSSNQNITDTVVQIKLESELTPTTWHERLEGKAFAMSIWIGIVVAIGGIIEFLPTFMIKSNVPIIAEVKPYTPLEISGRDIYIAEGCYNCHSQMVRTYDLEVKRYGQRSHSGEFIYDRPFQWGSKRTGPDLHRVGGKYPDYWHYKHFIDPRSMTPGSIMPEYSWFKDTLVDLSDLSAKLKVLKKLGADYPNELINQPLEAYKEQADKIVENLAKEGITIDYKSQMIAMIAYMQRLGIDIKNSDIKD